MFADRKAQPQKPIIAAPPSPDNGGRSHAITLLTVVGEHARMEGKFDITDSIQIECEVGGEVSYVPLASEGLYWTFGVVMAASESTSPAARALLYDLRTSSVGL